MGEGSTYRPELNEFQQLIRYVERWRMAHFQRPDARVRDADELLKKLRRGMATVAEDGLDPRMQSGPAWVS
jgi:hypothetical protein